MRTKSENLLSVADAKTRAHTYRYHFKLGSEANLAFQQLADRLQFEPEEAAAWLINAAVEALKDETHIIWPIYLQQAGQIVSNEPKRNAQKLRADRPAL